MAPSASQKYKLQDILRQVYFGEVVTTTKAYLLALLGRERDRPEAWAELLELYEDVGGDRNDLHGLDLGHAIALSNGKFERVSSWAKE